MEMSTNCFGQSKFAVKSQHKKFKSQYAPGHLTFCEPSMVTQTFGLNAICPMFINIKDVTKSLMHSSKTSKPCDASISFQSSFGQVVCLLRVSQGRSLHYDSHSLSTLTQFHNNLPSFHTRPHTNSKIFQPFLMIRHSGNNQNFF